MGKPGRATGLTAALALLVGVVAGVVVTQTWPRDLTLHDVARLMPADTVSVDATDWSAIREALDVPRDELVAEASSRDLVTRSILAASGENVIDNLGWAPATVRWEAWVQTPAGSMLFVGLPGSADEAEEALRGAGWTPEAGLWRISSPEGTTPSHLTHVRLLDGDVAVAADDAAVLDVVLDVVSGDRVALGDDPASVGAWQATASLAAFGLQRAEAGCASTSPYSSGPDIAAQADVAKDAAGTLQPYRWLVRGLDAASGQFVVAMAFESSGTAAGQVAVRSKLATGPFIGQNGDIEDSIALEHTRVDGDVAVLDFEHQPQSSVALMSFIGPMVPASC